MGTRYEDQPPELWAGPESLDPTPVWKQFALIGIFLALGLVLIGGVAVFAAAPQLTTPPALVAGDRLVLASSSIPPAGRASLIAPPLVDDAHSFYLVQPEKGQVIALRTHWAPRAGGPDCAVAFGTESVGFGAGCPGGVIYAFDLSGRPRMSGAFPDAPRGLDQYLVSVSGDRVIVNLSRVIEGEERTTEPVPRGIPQPQGTP